MAPPIRLNFLAITICISLSLTILITRNGTFIKESLLSMPRKLYSYSNPDIISHKSVDEMLVKYSTNTDSFAAACNVSKDLYKLQSQLVGNVNTTVAIRTSKETKCPKKRFQLRPGLPRTALLSYEGSGNTWVRHLLQQMTGLPTGSIYKDMDLLLQGFPFEGKVNDVLVVKTHGINHKKMPLYVAVQDFDRIIVLFRNVCDSFTAEFKRGELQKGHKNDSHIDTKDLRWRGYIEPAVFMWERLVQDAFNFTGPILVVFYEDLKSQLLTELIRMAEFLTCDDLTEFSFCCAVTEREGRFHRKSSFIQHGELFDRNFRQLLNDMIHRVVNQVLISRPQIAERILSYTMPLVF